MFRGDNGELLRKPYVMDVVTCPAVNAEVVRRNAKAGVHKVEEVMRERIRRILEVAYREGKKDLVLGAFGCGVFRNDAKMVAAIFKELLRGEKACFVKCFERVVFAIYDPKGYCLRAFQEVFDDS